MKEGDAVQVLGVWQTSRVPCDDEQCEYEHFDNRPELGRYHYEDAEREGRLGEFVGYEPFRGDDQGKLVVRLVETGTVVSCDPDDVEEVKG